MVKIDPDLVTRQLHNLLDEDLLSDDDDFFSNVSSEGGYG